MHPQLEEAAIEGNVNVLEQIQKGEFTDSDFFFAGSFSGYNFVQYAAQHKRDDFICKVFNEIKEPKILQQLLVHQSEGGANSLHSTVWYGCRKATKAIINFYRSWCKNKQKVPIAQRPWNVVNIFGRTPFHDALEKGYDDLACYLLLLDRSYLYNKVDKQNQSPLFLAVKNGCRKVIEEILCPQHHLPVTGTSFIGPEKKTALHQAIISKSEASVVDGLLKKLEGKTDLIWKKDSKGWTALHYAISQEGEEEEGENWRVGLLLKERPPLSILWKYDPNWESPLILALKLGRHSTVQTIVRCCPSMLEWRGQNNTTLLHHIELDSQQGYEDLLEIPEIKGILNIKDDSGMTPLHQAICNGNLILSELLFQKDGVNKAIKNKEGKTPIDLLREMSQQSPQFAALRKRILPKASFLPDSADMKEVRSTVMVVAALLATITFQAAFTIPDVTLKRRPLFVIFLMADTFAMCCSLVVLFWLIWAMVEDDFESQKLADRSIFVLALSFYGTLVAFVAVAFAIALGESLTLAIIVAIICFFVPLFSSRTIVSKFFKVEGLFKRSRPSDSHCRDKIAQV